MSAVIIYHNPRCQKSRRTLELLRQQGVDPEIIEYLKTPPSESELKTISKTLGVKAKALVRKKESLFKELALDEKTLTETEWIKTLVEHPRLLERPIVVNGDKAALGRPPEKVLDIL